jgi:hypothetical protein
MSDEVKKKIEQAIVAARAVLDQAMAALRELEKKLEAK